VPRIVAFFQLCQPGRPRLHVYELLPDPLDWSLEEPISDKVIHLHFNPKAISIMIVEILETTCLFLSKERISLPVVSYDDPGKRWVYLYLVAET